MDQFEAAFTVFMQEAGARCNDFMGRPSTHVPEDVLDDAAQTLYDLAQREQPDVEPTSLNDLRQEAIAQAFEEIWSKVASPALKKPEKRAQTLLFFEEQAGRPMPLAAG